MTPERLEREPRVVELVPDFAQGGWTAAHPDLPGCIAQGQNIEEALQNLTDTRRLWEECYLECHEALPDPDDLGPSHHHDEAMKEIRRLWAARDEVLRRASPKTEESWTKEQYMEIQWIIEPLRKSGI